ncbi:AAA family ATPase [Panacibacter ginsenosidivorans]|uniref:AAA family ATPase n=1 Tax=Panacibacter ginsenosidivorans TaxID=1813871 RepID=A0A5B8V6N3_9BACT|nr:ATP-binding protein [Panacibacter ginsenosidivorans]QEC67137.1 AAA family ATPase [Panacibacter ginsenosidivorans]
MNKIIEQLKQAVNISPDNIPLRLHLAEMMLQQNLLSEASEQFSEILKREHSNTKALGGLADIYFKQNKYSAAIILFEQLQQQHALNFENKIKLVRCLLKENSITQAKEIYAQALTEQPNFRDAEIDSVLRMTGIETGMDAEELLEELATSGKYFMEKPSVKFADVGGMQKIKSEISLKIIQPLKNPDLYKAFGKKIGGGILMYGPPGCGKTFLAKATAGEIDAKFITLGLHDILDMWMGNSEKNLHEVFQAARKNTPCVLFIDEVDALGASRSDMRTSAMRQIINQFLAELDGVKDSNEGVLILAATNAPWSVDSAFRRPGRFDRVIFVAPPDEESRKEILDSLIKDKPTEKIDTKDIAKLTPGYSGADLKALIDIAVESKLEESLAKGSLQAVTQKDITKAIKVHKPTTAEWFSTARNYALYANETGLYDDILQYLNLKK